MKIAVKDANILIDLVNGNLLEACLTLPYEFVTTDTVLFELEREDQWLVVQPFVDDGSIKKVTIESVELIEIASDPLLPTLGLIDLQVLWIAKREKGILLTGDLELREVAKDRSIRVHGLLWILQQLVDARSITANAAARALNLVKTKGARLPTTECERLLREWER